MATLERDASRSACAREWSPSRRRLRASTCEATAILSSPTLVAADFAEAGDAAGERVAAAPGLATSGERAAGLALARALGLGLGFGEAEEPGEDRKLILGSAGKEDEPGDDDAGEETACVRARVRVGAASGERKEGFGFGLGLALPRLALDVEAVALGLPMAAEGGGVSSLRLRGGQAGEASSVRNLLFGA